MKIINIPYSPYDLFVYSGNDRENFDLKVKHKYPEWEGDEDSDGLHYENCIYIEDMTDYEVVIHEGFHFLDWLFTEMLIIMEPEFKANIASTVLNKLLFK